MKNFVWQQNRHQKVFYRGALQYICAVGLDILKFEQTSLHHCFVVLHTSIWEGGLELCFGGAKPTKGPPW